MGGWNLCVWETQGLLRRIEPSPGHHLAPWLLDKGLLCCFPHHLSPKDTFSWSSGGSLAVSTDKLYP